MCAVLEISPKTYYKYRNKEDPDYYDYDELKKQEAYELGEASGVEQNKVEIALNMLRESTNSDFICRVTGLSLDEVEKLRKGL